MILGMVSCSSSFIKKERKRTINLNSLSKNSIKVGVENESVIIKFNRTDIIYLFEQDLKQFKDQRIQGYVEDLKALKEDTIFDRTKLNGTLFLMEYELKFHDLLKKGKAEIIDKEENEKLDRIKYKFLLDKLGGKEAFFYKMNGKKIYQVLLALGE